MNDSELFQKFSKPTVKDEEKEISSLNTSSTDPLSSPQEPVNTNNKTGVYIRTLMQKTVFKVYPNGMMSIDKSQSTSWINESRQMFTPKKKKKAKEGKKVEFAKLENIKERSLL